ncbi:MAG: T9SS type A sorting domain-containing protein, partial [Chitinophagales bacterium]|nr:T9SS type A sorting domain-containing protein [Chitinophagales bacterium]
NYVASEGKQQEMKFYFVSGTNESSDMVPDIRSMYSTMYNDGFTADEMDTVFVTNGAHAEWFWAQEFGGCYNWLFDNTIISVEEPEPDSIFNISPNPAQKKINLTSKYPMKKIEVEIYDSNGQRIFSSTQQFSKAIDVSKMNNGLYYLKIKDQNKIYSKIFTVMK